MNATSSQLFCPLEFTYENMFGSNTETRSFQNVRSETKNPIDFKDRNNVTNILGILSRRTEEIMRKISSMESSIKQLRIFKEAAQTTDICHYCKIFFDELTKQKKEISEIIDLLNKCICNMPMNFTNFQTQVKITCYI